MSSPVDASVEIVLLHVLIQLAVIISIARLCGTMFRAFGQPQVCGEIAAGLLLGPSVLGRFLPAISATVFHASAASSLTILSQLGLIMLMFLIGLEFDFGHLRPNSRAAASISIAGIALPFGLGLLSASLLYPYVGEHVDRTGFFLFTATALSITALPILGRMLVEFNLHRTRLGCIAIGAAALDDVAGWTLLAVVTALVRSRFSPRATLAMIAETMAFALFMLAIARPLFSRWASAVVRRHAADIPLSALAITLVCVLVSATITNLIGLFSVFGGFIMGAILYDQHQFKE